MFHYQYFLSYTSFRLAHNLNFRTQDLSLRVVSLLFLAPCAEGEEAHGETDDCHGGESCWPVHSCETPVYPLWQGAKTVSTDLSGGLIISRWNCSHKLDPVCWRIKETHVDSIRRADVSLLPLQGSTLCSKRAYECRRWSEYMNILYFYMLRLMQSTQTPAQSALQPSSPQVADLFLRNQLQSDTCGWFIEKKLKCEALCIISVAWVCVYSVHCRAEI